MSRLSTLVIIGFGIALPAITAIPSARAQKPEGFKESAQEAKTKEFLSKITAVPLPSQKAANQVRFRPQRQIYAVQEPAEEVRENEDEDEETPLPQDARRIGGKVVLPKQVFETFLFGNMTTKEERHAWLSLLLDEELARASRDHPLSAEQKEKLRLAARGDVKRFFEQVDEKRVEFEVARKDLQKGVNFTRQLAPLGRSFEFGPYGSNSLFSKTLRKIRDDERRPVPQVR